MPRLPLLPQPPQFQLNLKWVIGIGAALVLLIINPLAAVALIVSAVVWWPGLVYARLLLARRGEGWGTRFAIAVLALATATMVAIYSAWTLLTSMLQWVPFRSS